MPTAPLAAAKDAVGARPPNPSPTQVGMLSGLDPPSAAERYAREISELRMRDEASRARLSARVRVSAKVIARAKGRAGARTEAKAKSA